MRSVVKDSAANLMVFMTDSSDHVSGKASLTLTITASKDGGVFGSITPTVTERGSGWYALALTSSHTDVLGDLALHITASGADPTDLVVQIVSAPADISGLALESTAQAVKDNTDLIPNLALETTAQAIKNQTDDIPGIALETTAQAIKAKTDNLPATPSATGDAMTLTSGERDSVADALLDRSNAVETGWTLRKVLRIIAAALAGKVSGAGTTEPVFRNLADTKDRITATVDEDGNRSDITLDGD